METYVLRTQVYMPIYLGPIFKRVHLQPLPSQAKLGLRSQGTRTHLEPALPAQPDGEALSISILARFSQVIRRHFEYALT